LGYASRHSLRADSNNPPCVKRTGSGARDYASRTAPVLPLRRLTEVIGFRKYLWQIQSSTEGPSGGPSDCGKHRWMLTTWRASAFRSAGLILLRSSAAEGFKLGSDGSVEGFGNSLEALWTVGVFDGVFFDGMGDWSFIVDELIEGREDCRRLIREFLI
jgi:hypothetical protein